MFYFASTLLHLILTLNAEVFLARAQEYFLHSGAGYPVATPLGAWISKKNKNIKIKKNRRLSKFGGFFKIWKSPDQDQIDKLDSTVFDILSCIYISSLLD